MADLFDIEGQSRISELVALIKKYQKSYYNGEAEISDADFDRLWDELKELDPSNAVLKAVGEDNGNFEKADHVMPMGSQEKAADPEQFLAWASNHKYDEYFVEYKLDGASLELQYRHGVLVKAVTRGNGVVGDDITFNARKMQGVQRELYDSDGNIIDFTGGVRGEVIMTHQVHSEYFSDKANCRNAANGLMKRKDGKGCEHLTLITYDALATEGKSPFEDEQQKIVFLQNCGFNTVKLYICSTAQQVIDYRAKVMDERKELAFDIDGLVVKERVINLADASRARPDRQIAFKFSLEEAVSVLRDVEWSESGATYTPVAIFDPVSLAGTTVQRASLANPGTMRALNVKLGCKVVVVKRGEIIPKIVSVVTDDEHKNLEDIKIPAVCSTCGSPLVDEDTRLYCPNADCSKRHLHQLLKWVSVIDIRDFGETLITSLFNDGVIKNICDIYTLTEQTLVPYFLNAESISNNKDSLGAKKVIDSISSHNEVSLSVFFAGFDIEGIGETMVQKIVDAGFNTFDKLIGIKVEEAASVYGFADITARVFVKGIAENETQMHSLVDNGYIKIKESSEGGAMTGKSFCFTGELVTMKRADAEALVKKNGGTCKSSVTKDLTYLVTNDRSSGSSKNVKAQKLGIPIISEQEFLQLI